MSAGHAWAAFAGVLRRDLKLGVRKRGEVFNPILFFVLVVSLFPLGVGPSPKILAEIAPGVIWVAALLATLLSMERLFRSDFEDGALEQLLLSPHDLPLLVLAKVLAHWLITGVPLIVVSPLLGVLLHLPSEGVIALPLTLLLGTPVLSLLGAIGVALTVGLRRGGVLLTLLVMPLYIPVLIFGTTAIAAAASGLPNSGQLALLGGLLALTLTLAPFAAAAGLRISVD
ncbi:MAG: heme exporter protein CcmB [Gammaproteobacteria bacterium]|nr:heme exporter protein CcmB [Gammaproteobacteria bacterium]MCP5424830.1 heme exporter protein CcmB [Gammaproteobacteria bacterium]MCP5458193.1 heme exporter protein CcmB [Gammaproteobacteria bacterium]